MGRLVTQVIERRRVRRAAGILFAAGALLAACGGSSSSDSSASDSAKTKNAAITSVSSPNTIPAPGTTVVPARVRACAPSSPCMPGDTREGTGGTIFYYNAVGFNCGTGATTRCSMLEYAPSAWASTVKSVPLNGCEIQPGVDLKCPMTNPTNVEVPGTRSQLGYGFYNSQVIATYAGTTGIFSANNFAVSYKDPNTGANIPWGLPSLDELVLLCNWANGSFPRTDACVPKALKPGFKPDFYLSSTVSAEPSSPVFAVNFGTGVIVKQSRAVASYVRPVRALRGYIDSTYVPPTTVVPTTVAPTTVAPATLPPTTLPPTTLAPTTLPPTTAVACAAGGACAVGNIGPGGGTVFFVSSAGFKCGPTLAQTCHYLEAVESDVAPQSGDFPEGAAVTGTEIGAGLKNTNAIAALGGPGNIAVTVRGLTLGTKSDWYIGSMSETNEFCKTIKFGGSQYKAPGNPTEACKGSMTKNPFDPNTPLKSSSLAGASLVWMIKLTTSAWEPRTRTEPNFFRVMRAF